MAATVTDETNNPLPLPAVRKHDHRPRSHHHSTGVREPRETQDTTDDHGETVTQPELDLIYFTDEQLAAIIEAWAAEKKNEKDT